MSEDKAPGPQTKDGKVTVELDDAVTYNNITHTSLTFRKRKVGDLVAADAVKGLVQKEAAVFASMAGVPLPVILDLSADDHDKVLEQTAPLMGKSWESVKMSWLTEMAMDAGVASGVQAELANHHQNASQNSD